MKRLSKFLPAHPGIIGTGCFFTDGNLENALRKRGVNLVHDAAFELLYSREGRQLLNSYHQRYLELAQQLHRTYILHTPTWRANADWIFKLGYPLSELAAVNRHAAQFAREIQYASSFGQVLISGCVGPRPIYNQHAGTMNADDASSYHLEQVRTLALADVDVISGLSITYAEEAIGIIRSARKVGVPVVISFSVSSDGTNMNGIKLPDLIAAIDDSTDAYAQYYMIQCEDPAAIFSFLNSEPSPWDRVRGAVLSGNTFADFGHAMETLPDNLVIGGDFQLPEIGE